MDHGSSSPVVKKQEDDDKPDKRDSKPVVKTLNRVPRACNACRKQKMRCENADNPPCRRCRNNGLECLFEKPSREATLTGEAGLERIRSLEAHVAEISRTQTTISNTLNELVAHIRGGAIATRSPSAYPPSFHHHSPTNVNSPSMSTPTASHPHINDTHNSPQAGLSNFPANTTPTMNTASLRPSRNSVPNTGYQNPSGPPPNQPPMGPEHPQPATAFGNYPHGAHAYNSANHGTLLPPFSSLQGTNMGPPPPQSNLSSMRFNNEEPQRPVSRTTASGKRRTSSSATTSPNTSDVEDDDHGELPSSGLVAPWEVLRGLADVASERAAKENGESSEPSSRTRTPSPERRNKRSFKRRKTKHETHPTMTADVVTKGIVTEYEARELFKTFYEGCSTFLPVFDASYDTYDALRIRSPFAVSCICMVAARVRDGGGKPSKMYKGCLEEIQRVSKESLFLQVRNAESVQAMILVAGWSDNGWLSGGHAVRMAMELSMHKAWPRLLRRIKSGKANATDDRDLVVASRIWFCLYLYEHQLSYGTGRPAIMKDDEGIRDCRRLLQHPLTIEDDMRLVSTVELMMLREFTHNVLAPFEGPVTPEHLDLLNRAGEKFNAWFDEWDKEFSRKYEDAAFYRQSLQLQVLHALLFHNASALRGINCAEDLNKAPSHLVELSRRSLGIAAQTVELTVKSATYRRGLRYAVHYTHATATFAASLLLRLCRLFPGSCNMQDVCEQVESLMHVLFDIPGKRYALTLQIMLAKRRRNESASTPGSTAAQVPQSIKSQAQSQAQADLHPPNSAHQPAAIASAVPVPGPQAPRTSASGLQQPSREMLVDNLHINSRVNHGHMHQPVNPNTEAFPPVYENTAFAPADASVPMPSHSVHNMHPAIVAQHAIPHNTHRYPHLAEAESMWQGISPESSLWTTDQSLGGMSFTQHGMDAFILPTDYLPQQIW